MKKQIFIGGAVAVLFVALLGVVKAFQIQQATAEAAARVMPPEAVTSHIAQKETWSRTVSSVGTLSPTQGAALSVELGGLVKSIHFESGMPVKKGDLLVSLNVSLESAELRKAKAKQELALQTAQRQRALRKRNANATADLDEAEEALKNTLAEVERISALIKQKQVRAPFSGVTGIRYVNVGQTIASGEPVVELNKHNPLYVDFTVPQKELPNIKRGDQVQVTLDAYPGKTFQAELNAIESRVNSATRTIAVQATLQNEDNTLRPGMFVDVKVVTDQQRSVISIPSSSIDYAPYGSSVYVIGKDDSEQAGRPVTSKVVTTGTKRGDRVEIISGINEGEEVVSSGTFKLRPGIRVAVNNVVQPQNKLDPNPRDT